VSDTRPVPPAERIERIDVLRGFALLGILPVNLVMMKAPASLRWSGAELYSGPFDDFIRGLIAMLFEGKFYPLFAMLFGVGLVMQGERLAAREDPPRRRLARRLAVLAGIGAAHAFGIWFGDILLTYALLGFVTLALFPVKRALLRVLAVLGIVGVPLAMAGLIGGALAVGAVSPEWRAEIDAQAVEAREESVEDLAEARAAYGSGSVGEILARNAQDVRAVYSYAWVWAPTVLGWILLGLDIGRSGLLADLGAHDAALRRAFRVLLPIGLIAGAVYAFANHLTPAPGPSPAYVVFQLASAIGAPALVLAYGIAVIVRFDDPRWRPRLAPLAPFGRMALTNYLLQSIMCVTLLYAPGFGLYERLSPAAGLLLAAAIVAIQIPLSGWWLRRFRFGPAEWLWRALTYGTVPQTRQR